MSVEQLLVPSAPYIVVRNPIFPSSMVVKFTKLELFSDRWHATLFLRCRIDKHRSWSRPENKSKSCHLQLQPNDKMVHDTSNVTHSCPFSVRKLTLCAVQTHRKVQTTW